MSKLAITAPAFLLVTALCGCAPSYLLIGAPRPPLSPDIVTVYDSPPPIAFEEIAILRASRGNSWAIANEDMTSKLELRLKTEAAQLGANGILLREASGSAYGFTGDASEYKNMRTVMAIHVSRSGASQSSSEPLATPTVRPEPTTSSQPTPMVEPEKRNAVGAIFGPDDHGLIVISIQKNGPAARAGLRVGDVITHINNLSIAPIDWKIAAGYISGTGNAVMVTVSGKGNRTLFLDRSR